MIDLQDKRAEALAVKSCTTDIFYKSLIFCAALLGAMLAGLKWDPIVSLAAVPAIYLIIANARIILHKYTTANRIYGYELHLSRVRATDQDPQPPAEKPQLADGGELAWQQWMTHVSWEEALRAWRVVQATCFRHCVAVPPDKLSATNRLARHIWWGGRGNYEQHSAIKDRTREWAQAEDEETRTAVEAQFGYPWWDTNVVATIDGGIHYSGSYIAHLLAFLKRMVWVFLGLLMWVALTAWLEGTPHQLITCVLVWRLIRFMRVDKELDRRRQLVESGMLSIDACAIIWQAVVLAHYRALDNDMRVGPGYTRRLGHLATNLGDNIGKIHQWVQAPELL